MPHTQQVCALRYIDGRVWPKQDELEVRLMMDLIHHVTGVFCSALQCHLSACTLTWLALQSWLQ